ncbi:LPS-assembly protein LptD [Candidatus Pelagibacter sp.]|uniref:LPS-assembly protein LptD n=1 Tax=Candidatus Pelagibacter sp. TaxID=2024849 RepID=UPI003F868B31
MKNRFYKIFAFICFFIFLNNNLLSEEIIFKTKEINFTENGEKIEALNGTAFSKINSFKIEAERFLYDKKKLILTAEKNFSKFEKSKINAISDFLKYDKNQSIIELNQKVIIKDLTNNLDLTGDKIIYDLNKKVIFSNTKSQLTDSNDNKYLTEKFHYDTVKKIIKLDKLIFYDNSKNKLTSEISYLDLVNQKLIGKDLTINLKDLKFNQNNEPRLKGKSYSYENNFTNVEKGNFTLCKIRNEKCPPWVINAEKITHNKKNKTIYYENAWLKVYDKPVMYFPKFFHPDPSVKRRSGFLMPSFENSNNTGSSLQIPYYHVFSNSSDLTLTPRLYDEEKTLIQSEFREEKKDSSIIVDASILKEKNISSKSHIFINQSNNLKLLNFSESELNFRLEQTSNDTYLKSYKVKSPIIKDNDTLTNTISLSGSREDLSFQSELHIFENLNKQNSDRYEVIYPSYEIEKKLNSLESLNGNIFLKSNGFQKKYNTNVEEQVVVNDIIFKSFPTLSTKGFKNSLNLLLKNTNTSSENSTKYKDHTDHKILSIGEINSTYPLSKKNSTRQQILTPKVSFRYSPNDSKDIRNTDNRIDVSNIFNFNRLSDNETVEGGGSITYGFNYSSSKDNREYFNSKIANVMRLSKNEDLPKNSKLGEKTSDIVGSLIFDPNNFMKFEYDFSQDENLKDNNYQLLKSEFKINNFVTSFEYLNENNTANKEHFLSNKSSYLIDEYNMLSYTTRRNKKTKLTEFYNLVYEYKNDCLKASLEYNKDYYNDRDIKPEENIFFRLTIMPFGETKGPNLK